MRENELSSGKTDVGWSVIDDAVIAAKRYQNKSLSAIRNHDTSSTLNYKNDKEVYPDVFPYIFEVRLASQVFCVGKRSSTTTNQRVLQGRMDDWILGCCRC